MFRNVLKKQVRTIYFKELKEAYKYRLSTFLSNEAKLTGMNDPIEGMHTVKDLSGNIFYIQIGEDGGFMVFDPVVSMFVEKSATLKSPYDFTRKGNYYYFGPMKYSLKL